MNSSFLLHSKNMHVCLIGDPTLFAAWTRMCVCLVCLSVALWSTGDVSSTYPTSSSMTAWIGFCTPVTFNRRKWVQTMDWWVTKWAKCNVKLCSIPWRNYVIAQTYGTSTFQGNCWLFSQKTMWYTYDSIFYKNPDTHIHPELMCQSTGLSMSFSRQGCHNEKQDILDWECSCD